MFSSPDLRWIHILNCDDSRKRVGSGVYKSQHDHVNFYSIFSDRSRGPFPAAWVGVRLALACVALWTLPSFLDRRTLCPPAYRRRRRRCDCVLRESESPSAACARGSGKFPRHHPVVPAEAPSPGGKAYAPGIGYIV
jgi:hypothetical protein